MLLDITKRGKKNQYVVLISLQLRDPSLHPPNGFKLGVLQGTFAESYFKNNIDHELRQLYNDNLKVNLMTQSSEGINKLQER